MFPYTFSIFYLCSNHCKKMQVTDVKNIISCLFIGGQNHIVLLRHNTVPFAKWDLLLQVFTIHEKASHDLKCGFIPSLWFFNVTVLLLLFLILIQWKGINIQWKGILTQARVPLVCVRICNIFRFRNSVLGLKL